MKLTLTSRPVDSLTPYGQNSKNHGDADISAIAASITRFGFNDPIGITPEGMIVEGHGRWEAAKRLGMPEVPCVVLEGGSDRQYDLYRIAHNKIALSTGFNFEVLVETMREVTASGNIQASDMGFSQEAFGNLCDMFAPTDSRAGRQQGQRPQSFEYDIIWDSKEQKDSFTAFLKKLKAKHPEIEEGTAFVQFAMETCTEFADGGLASEEQTNAI